MQTIMYAGRTYRVDGTEARVFVPPKRTSHGHGIQREHWRVVSRSTFIYAWLMARAAGAPLPYVPERSPGTAPPLEPWPDGPPAIPGSRAPRR